MASTTSSTTIMDKVPSAKSVVGRVRNFYNINSWKTEPERDAHNYLYGLRGILAISSILWIFFETFIPAVANTGAEGPTYQKIIRIVFSPILWNSSLISAFFFILSARSIGVRFLQNPKPVAFAGSIIRRIFRMSIAVGLASGLASAIFHGIGTTYISDFKSTLPNHVIEVPGLPNNALTALNSMFDLFWVVRQYSGQAANNFWPSATIWNLSLIYQQSWTVYFLMLVLPYTRATWHKSFLGLFAFGSFWMNSWGWYDAIALLLADYVVNPKLRPALDQGFQLTETLHVLPFIPAAIMTAIGVAFKYVWTAVPQYHSRELVLHPFLDLSERTSVELFAADDEYPRLDNFMVIFGILLFIESSGLLRHILSAKWLVCLGKRSLSLFVAQSIVFWTAGIKLFMHLHASGTSTGAANLAVFVVCTLTTFAAAELYYRIVDVPSQWIAAKGYLWLTT